MHITVRKLKLVQNKIKEILDRKQQKTIPQIIAVTKTWPMSKIIPLLEIGHMHFGENKIQEAENKWLEIKNKYNDLQLHMLGKLQSNKTKKAVKIFDYIHSLDNIKIAKKISQHEQELKKKIKLLKKQKVKLIRETLDKYGNFYLKNILTKIKIRNSIEITTLL